MTVKEFAKKVKKSLSTIYRWIKSGRIKAEKKNRRWNIQQADNMPKKILVNDMAHELQTSRPSIFYAAEDVGVEIFWDMEYDRSRKYKNQVHWIRSKDVVKVRQRILAAYK